MNMEYSEIPTTRIAGSGKINVPGYGAFKISGSGMISPEEIATSGSSVIPGGLKIGSIRTSGSSRVQGDITAETMKSSGSSQINGSLTCDELSSSGSLHIDGDMTLKYGKTSGSAKIDGKSNVEREFESSGSIGFGDDLVSQGRILYAGVMRGEGKVISQSFEARLSRDESYIKEGIEAEYINIQRSHEDWRNRGSLFTGDIIGDEILLENVECENVKGRKITILRGCHIKSMVEYSEKIEVDPDSKLDNEPEKT
jgi:cytoskeletal protein CcmA (bactofilin family)